MANQANNQRLNGLNPLSYLGVDAYSPANLIIQSYSPTANDSSNVQVGAWWLNSTTNNMFYLASLSGYTATWIQILSAANNLTFTALPSGDIAVPVADVINFQGAGGTVVTASGNTVLITSTNDASNSFVTDSGTATPTADVINIIAGNSTRNSGSTVLFSAATNVIILNVSDANNNTIIGLNAGKLANSSSGNVGLGVSALTALASGTGENTAIGAGSLIALTGGSGENTAIGYLSGSDLLTGSNNIYVGIGAGSNNTSSESNNIYIGNLGNALESGVIRVGTSQTACFIKGINGVNVGSVATVVTENGDQLGTAVLTAGSNIIITPTANTITIAAASDLATTFVTNPATGTATPSSNQITFAATGGSTFSASGSTITLNSNNPAQSFVTDSGTATPVADVLNIKTINSLRHCGSTVLFAAFSTNTVELTVSDANSNTMIGSICGNLSNTSPSNTFVGQSAAGALVSGSGENTGVGVGSFTNMTTGSSNVGIGWGSGSALLTGTGNIYVGWTAGIGNTSSESNNIYIGSTGAAGESGVTRIGANGTQTAALIAGIYGNVALTTRSGVWINSNGELSNLGFTATPAFSASTAVNVTNATGDGTLFSPTFITVAYDQDSNYDGTSTFTAPVTGIYIFEVEIILSNIGAAHTTGLMYLTTTGGTYRLFGGSPYDDSNNAGVLEILGTAQATMTAGDTASVRVSVSNGTKVVAVGPTSGFVPTFSGYFLC
jgi:hypothetical protein